MTGKSTLALLAAFGALTAYVLLFEAGEGTSEAVNADVAAAAILGVQPGAAPSAKVSTSDEARAADILGQG